MDLIAINLLDGAVTGLLLFMLTAGLTLIFSMMGVLNFAHASFYMLGAYFGYQISKILAFWLGYDAGFFAAVIVAPVVVGLMGAAVERYGLRRVHRHGHVPELIFTFGLAFLIEEIVEFFWGVNLMAFDLPPILDQTLFSIGLNAFPAYKVFMIAVTIGVFLVLLGILRGTRVGLVIQAALSHPQMVEALGHNVPRVFMGVFGAGTALAGLAGVIAGPVLGTFPGMAFVLGSIVFVVIVIGGLGSLVGALIASMLIGWMTTFAKAYNVSGSDVLGLVGLVPPEDLDGHPFRDIWTMTLPQIADILPYLFLILVLVFRPYGLMGRRA